MMPKMEQWYSSIVQAGIAEQEDKQNERLRMRPRASAATILLRMETNHPAGWMTARPNLTCAVEGNVAKLPNFDVCKNEWSNRRTGLPSLDNAPNLTMVWNGILNIYRPS